MTRRNDPIRILIGAGPDERIPALVLEHTIRKNTQREVEVIHTFDRKRPGRGRRDQGGADPTCFSFVRLWIPELCGFTGHCIYLDSDMVVFSDIGEIWDMNMGGAHVLQTPPLGRTEVMLIDCEACKGWNAWDIVKGVEAGTIKYGDAVSRLMGAKCAATIPEVWNHRDQYAPKQTKLLHYTRLHAQGGRYNSQPWAEGSNHELGYLWWREARECGVAGELEPANG